MGCATSRYQPTNAKAKSHPIWDRFQRVQMLGQGASATVWLAQNLKAKAGDSVWCALKLIDKTDAFSRQVYEHETSMLKVLAHPNILTLVDSFETPEVYVIVTQYLAGGEMFDRLQELHHYTEQTASKMAKKMLQALYYCHKHDVVHRDLKPENYCYVSKAADSELKLIDFGEALTVKEDEVHDDGVGTPYYVAPEIVDNDFKFPRNGKVLKGADVWSLGVIFYMMLTGYPPFDGEDDDEIMDATMIGEFDWPANIQVSDQAKDLVSKMLTVDHTKRITAAEALNHPWIANHESNSDVSLNDALKALKDFSTAALMKKAVANILIKEMTEEDTAKLRRLFDELDTDGDRTLDLEEITVYMRHHGYETHEEAVAAAKIFMEAVDETKRGTINFLEFENAHMRGQLGTDAVAIRKAFDAIDTDKSGTIDIKELRSLLGDETAETISDLINEISGKQEDEISFQLFFTAMTKENLSKSANKKEGRLRGFMSSSRRTIVSHQSSGAIDSKSKMRRLSSFGGSSFGTSLNRGHASPTATNTTTNKVSKPYLLQESTGSDDIGVAVDAPAAGRRVGFAAD